MCWWQWRHPSEAPSALMVVVSVEGTSLNGSNERLLRKMALPSNLLLRIVFGLSLFLSLFVLALCLGVIAGLESLLATGLDVFWTFFLVGTTPTAT